MHERLPSEMRESDRRRQVAESRLEQLRRQRAEERQQTERAQQADMAADARRQRELDRQRRLAEAARDAAEAAAKASRRGRRVADSVDAGTVRPRRRATDLAQKIRRLNPQNLQQAIILQEIFDKPVAMRHQPRDRWEIDG